MQLFIVVDVVVAAAVCDFVAAAAPAGSVAAATTALATGAFATDAVVAILHPLFPANHSCYTGACDSALRCAGGEFAEECPPPFHFCLSDDYYYNYDDGGGGFEGGDDDEDDERGGGYDQGRFHKAIVATAVGSYVAT